MPTLGNIKTRSGDLKLRGECLVYLITAGSKSYVGVTHNLKKRCREHLKCDTLVGRAMRKHPWTVKVLSSGTRQECLRDEMRLIEELGTLNPGGYNLTVGGDGVVGEAQAVRASRSRAMKVVMSRPDRKAAASATATQLWADPQSRAKLMVGLSAASKKMSDRARAAWAVRKGMV